MWRYPKHSVLGLGLPGLMLAVTAEAYAPLTPTLGPTTSTVADGLAWHFRTGAQSSFCTTICADNPTHKIHAAPEPPNPDDAVNETGAGAHNNFASGMCEDWGTPSQPGKHPSCGVGGGGANGNGNGGGNGNGNGGGSGGSLTLALIERLDTALQEGDVNTIRALVASAPSATIVAERRAVQVLGCWNEVIAHFTLPAEVFSAVTTD